MSEEWLKKILQQYGYAEVRLCATQKGYRNQSYGLELPGGDTVNLIVYKREPGIVERIERANYVADFLADQGMPARHTLDSRILQLLQSIRPQYAALYNYLPGATIPWESYTMEHIKQLGAAMSTMHAALQTLARQDLQPVTDECLAQWDTMERYFKTKGVRTALADKLNLQVVLPKRILAALLVCQALPAQPLHMDFVRGNILFSETPKLHISGILDFEKTGWGNPVLDIARTMAFLLVDCKYKNEQKVRKYFLHSGYNKRGQRTFTPSPLLDQLVDFFLLYDLYKFLKHNPYESLTENEHFMRTRAFLLTRNIVVSS